MVLKDCLNNLIQDYLNKGKQYTVASIKKIDLGKHNLWYSSLVYLGPTII